MKKVKLVAVSSLVLYLLLPGILSAEEIGILPFRTTGVENYVEDAFYEFLEDELDYYDHRVVSPYEIEHYLGRRVIAYNKDYAADYGTSLGLEKVIFGSMTRYGDEYIITVEVVRSRTGEILLYDRITLESEDHLDVYVYSLAESIEREIYGRDIYYTPRLKHTYTHVYIGTHYPRRVIVRRPRRSLITVRLPLINLNLGKRRKIYHRSPRKTKIVHKKVEHREPRHEKRDHEKRKREKSREVKYKKHDRDGDERKKGKRR